ncbi:MAG: lipoprotein insertase outer membrane protein LolB [Pseudomonadota bacterium]
MITRLGIAAVVALATLTACATPEKPLVLSLDASEVTARQAVRDRQLQTLPGWRFTGRVKVEGNERPTTAEIQWTKRGDQSRITLSGPGGYRASTLEVSPGKVVLRRAEGDVIRADDPDQLIERLVGWPMPLSLMNDWVLGLPGPANVLARDSQAHLERTQYREWDGQLSGYRSVDDLSMPHRIRVTDGHLRVAISVRQWEIGLQPVENNRRVPIPGVGS